MPNPGLCATCTHKQEITSDRGSTFVRCSLSDTDPSFPKYPRLPVIQCSGYKQNTSMLEPTRQSRSDGAP